MERQQRQRFVRISFEFLRSISSNWILRCVSFPKNDEFGTIRTSPFAILCNESNPCYGVIAFESKARRTEILEADPICTVCLVPNILEAGTACPSHEHDGPASVVRMFPEIIQPQI